MAMESVVAQKGKSAGLEIRHMAAAIGAEVIGLDLARPVSDELFNGTIRPLLHERAVVVFRGQRLDDQQHIAFSRHFGELMRLETLGSNLKKGCPEIFVISNVLDADGKNIGLPDAGKSWHVDASYEKIPSYVSLFRAIEVPKDDAGNPLGNTVFASAAAAYDALPSGMKSRLAGLKAIHRSVFHTDGSRHNMGKIERGEMDRLLVERGRKPTDVYADVVHPVVRTDPVTGRKCLFVNEAYTIRVEGMPRDESDALLAELYAHATAPQFVYSHKWQEDDLVIWDNVAVQHKATFDYRLPKRRVMHRTTVLGTLPIE